MGSVLNMDRLRDEWVRRAPEVSYCNPDDPLLRQVMIRAVELVTGQPRLQRIYNDATGHARSRTTSGSRRWNGCA